MVRRGRNIPSLDVEVVDEDKLEKNPAGVAGKQLPVLLVPGATLGDGNGVDVVGDGERDLDPKVHDKDTLGAELVGQNLDGVGDQETRPGERVSYTVKPDEKDVDVSNGDLVRLRELLSSDGGADQEDKHTTSGGEEELAPTNTVDQQGAGDGDKQRQNLVTSVQSKLLGLASDTCTFVDDTCVVADDGVAGPLREETKGDDEHETLAVTGGLDEVHVRGALLVQEFNADSLLHLSILEHDSGVAVVVVGMVVGKHAERLVVPVLGQQPTWGFRDPPDEGELDDGEDTLDQGWDSPGPGAGDVLSAESQPTTDQGTKIPQAVVDGGDPSTMLRVSDFGDKHRAGELSHGVAETHEETGTLILWAAHGGGLDSGGDNHDDATSSDGSLAAKLVADERDNRERDDGTDRVHGAETTQGVLRRVTHSDLPGVQKLRSVHKRSSHS